MPRLFLDNLDDQPVYDAVDGWVGGMVSNERTSRLEGNQVALLQNLDISREGLAKTRYGSRSLGNAPINSLTTKIQGLVWYDHIESGSQVQELLAFVDRDIYSWDGATWTLAVNNAVTNATVQVQAVTHLNTVYYLDGTINLFSWDGTTNTDLGGGGATSPPAAASLIETIANRLAVSGVAAAPTEIHFSTIGATPTWATASQVIQIGQGENDPITCLLSWRDFNLVVFKLNSTWVVNCAPFDGTTAIDIAEFPITRLHDSVGCVGPRAACQVGTDVWFLAGDGVHTVKRDVSGLNNEVSLPVSSPIQDVIDRINWDHASKAAATFYENRFMLAVPLDGATSPNYVIVYSTLTQSWSGYWTGMDPTCFAYIDFNGTQELVFGRTDARVRRWLNHQDDSGVDSYRDDGADITTALRTRGMICGEPFNPKQPFWVEMEWFNSEAQCTVSIVADEASDYRLGEFSTANTLLTLPFTLPATLRPNGVKRIKRHIQHRPPFRELQLVLETSAGKVAHRAGFLAGFVNTYDLNNE